MYNEHDWASASVVRQSILCLRMVELDYHPNFPSDYTSLYTHQQWMNSPLNPHSPQNDLSFILLILTILTGASQPFVFFVLRILYLDIATHCKIGLFVFSMYRLCVFYILAISPLSCVYALKIVSHYVTLS